MNLLQAKGFGHVKICGVTRVRDARLAVDLGADLIGLNFWPRSPRFLEMEKARAIADAVRGKALSVGVFVNRCPEEIAAIQSAVGLDLIQFHGDESDDEVLSWGPQAIKALRLQNLPEPDILQRYRGIWGVLFDIHHADYGGTGIAWDYSSLSSISRDDFQGQILVAGGVRPENARFALKVSGAWGIDVCSGVEFSPGVKDPQRMHHLFAEVHDGECGSARKGS